MARIYSKDMTAVYARLDELLTEGLSYQLSAKALNREGFTTVTGKKWTGTSVYKFLNRKPAAFPETFKNTEPQLTNEALARVREVALPSQELLKTLAFSNLDDHSFRLVVQKALT